MDSETEISYEPKKILTPEVVAKLLDIRRQLAGPMLGDPFPNFVRVTASLKWCDIDPSLLTVSREQQSRLLNHMRDRLALLTQEPGDKFDFGYNEAIQAFFQSAILIPELCTPDVELIAERIFELLPGLISGDLPLRGLRLASALYLTVPQERTKITEIVVAETPRLCEALHSGGHSLTIGAHLLLFNPDARPTLHIPPRRLQRDREKVLRQLKRVKEEHFFGDAVLCKNALLSVFTLSVLKAEHAELRSDGTIAYHFPEKLHTTPPLPPRNLV